MRESKFLDKQSKISESGGNKFAQNRPIQKFKQNLTTLFPLDKSHIISEIKWSKFVNYQKTVRKKKNQILQDISTKLKNLNQDLDSVLQKIIFITNGYYFRLYLLGQVHTFKC